MFLYITDTVIKNISTLHTLEFYLLCPDGRRFPVADLCKQYATKADGIFMRTFEDRLVVVIQAVFPDGKVYWNQAFYRSTGTSLNWLKGKQNANDMRANTWMPFHGIVLKQVDIRKYNYSFRNKKTTLLDPNKIVDNFYFQKLAQLKYRPFNQEKNKNISRNSIDQVIEAYGSFLPEGENRGYSETTSHLFDRFDTVSYLLASHAMGGNAFTYEINSASKDPFRHIHHIIPKATSGWFTHLFPELSQRLAIPSPPQTCLDDAVKTTPVNKPNEINDFIESQGAIGRMNLFRAIGMPDIPVPGLSISSVKITNLPYKVPLQVYEELLNGYVSYQFVHYKLGLLSLDDLVAAMKGSISDIIRFENKNKKEQFHSYAPDDEGVTFTLSERAFAQKNYMGGRKSRRHSKKTKRTRKNSSVY
jgi:hypothetical protein